MNASNTQRNVIRLSLLAEAASFALASAIHSGWLVMGYEHPQARIGEGVIGVVLLAGVALTWFRPAWLTGAALAAQGFALLGTLVGIFTIVIGVGPRTTPDIIYHVAIVFVLVAGISAAKGTGVDRQAIHVQ